MSTTQEKLADVHAMLNRYANSAEADAARHVYELDVARKEIERQKGIVDEYSGAHTKVTQQRNELVKELELVKKERDEVQAAYESVSKYAADGRNYIAELTIKYESANDELSSVRDALAAAKRYNDDLAFQAIENEKAMVALLDEVNALRLGVKS